MDEVQDLHGSGPGVEAGEGGPRSGQRV
jgi:hypothetical protein